MKHDTSVFCFLEADWFLVVVCEEQRKKIIFSAYNPIWSSWDLVVKSALCHLFSGPFCPLPLWCHGYMSSVSAGCNWPFLLIQYPSECLRFSQTLSLCYTAFCLLHSFHTRSFPLWCDCHEGVFTENRRQMMPLISFLVEVLAEHLWKHIGIPARSLSWEVSVKFYDDVSQHLYHLGGAGLFYGDVWVVTSKFS